MKHNILLWQVFLIIKEYDYTKKDGISRQEVIDQLNNMYQIQISLKQVSEIVEKLNQVLDYIKLGKIKTIHNVGYAFTNHYFSDAELRYLLDFIQTSKGISNQEANILQHKLIDLSSKNQLQRIAYQEINTNDQDKSLFNTLNVLSKAIYNKQSIKFHYVEYQIYLQRDKYKYVEEYRKNGNVKDNQGVPNFYLVSPYEIFMMDGKYYLIGYFDKRKNQLSTYRLDRMRIVSIVGKKGYQDYLEQFDLKGLKSQMVNMYLGNDIQDVRLRFDKTIFNSMIDQFGESFEIMHIHQNQIEVIIPDVVISEGFIGWILMLSKHIEIIYPLSLKDKIVERIHEILNIYKEE